MTQYKAVADFDATMNAFAEAYDMAGLSDMVRAVRASQTKAHAAFDALVAEVTAPTVKAPKAEKRRWYKTPETLAAAQQRARNMAAAHHAHVAAKKAAA